MDADRHRSARRRGGGCEGEDGAAYESTSGADGQDDRGEDGTPNSHDCLHASTEWTACELDPAATPDPVSRADHRQPSADYRK